MPRLNVYVDDKTYYQLKRIALDNEQCLSEFIRDGLYATIDAYLCANGEFKKLSLDSIQVEKSK